MQSKNHPRKGNQVSLSAMETKQTRTGQCKGIDNAALCPAHPPLDAASAVKAIYGPPYPARQKGGCTAHGGKPGLGKAVGGEEKWGCLSHMGGMWVGAVCED